jgi:hypothetical protein
MSHKDWVFLRTIDYKHRCIVVYEVDFLTYGFRVTIDGDTFELTDSGLIAPVEKCKEFIDSRDHTPTLRSLALDAETICDQIDEYFARA